MMHLSSMKHILNFSKLFSVEMENVTKALHRNDILMLFRIRRLNNLKPHVISEVNIKV